MKKKSSGGFSLFPRILALSVSQEWHTAKLEWILDYIFWNKEGSFCICGHFIKEECSIKNIENGNEAIVGNCCIRHFLDIEVGNAVFRALRNNKVTPSLVEYASDQGIINAWEARFLRNTCRKRRLTRKQANIFVPLKRRIFKACKMEEKHEETRGY